MERNERTVGRTGVRDSRSARMTVDRRREGGTEHETTCLCDKQPISLAMAYVRNQPFENLYAPSEALRRGTLFADLNLPYYAGGIKR